MSKEFQMIDGNLIASFNLEKQIDKNNQDKISFAVEQLEKLKVELHIIHTNGYLKAIDEEIDNQIKKLKEKQNEHKI